MLNMYRISQCKPYILNLINHYIDVTKLKTPAKQRQISTSTLEVENYLLVATIITLIRH